MLGKLFNLTTGAGASAGSSTASHPGQASGAPEPVSSLESVQEDLHTRSLLYPDAQALFQHRHDQVFPLPSSPKLSAAASLGSAFDYDGDIDLDMRDVRILIMQDGISSIPSSLLYDSQAPPPPSAPAVPDRPSTMGGLSHLNHGLQDSSRRVPTSPRKPSLSHAARPVIIQPDSPQLRQSATFDRRPSLHRRSQSRLETDAQRAYREYADEINIFSSCIFGTSELLAYRGTSTKVHVLPSDARAADLSSSAFHDGRGSLGRSSMKSSKLSQSFSSESAALFSPPPTSSSSSLATSASRAGDRKRVLITRLFPVTLPSDEDPGSAITPHSRFSEESGNSGSYPFPAYGDDGNIKKKKKAQLKQKRTPMYAIALIVNLPQPPPPLAMQVPSASRNTFRGPGSYTEQDSFPSSYGSGRRVGWQLATAAVGGNAGSGLGIDLSATDPALAGLTPSGGVIGATTDIEERMDPITQHWDIIMRTLTQMQTVASATILALLRAVDVASPDPYPPSVSPYVSRTASFSGRRSDDGSGPMKTPKTNAKLVTLMPNALMDMDRITREVDSARSRIAVGLRALRVVTGQNRWGIWREEARWVSRWAASVREKNLHSDAQQQQHQTSHLQPAATLHPPISQNQDQFLYNLLTAFLSTHTDWLQALSPAKYRKRHLLLQSNKGNDDSLPSRTIVVCRDKIAARRIIFLLSAFLPAAQSFPGIVRAHRPSTSMSWGALSQSPPASFVVPILKEQSLRRKINRRGAGGSGRRSSHSRNLSLQGQTIGGSGVARSASMSVAGAPPPMAHLHLYKGQHERRPSDTASIRTANLPFTGNDFNTRKSSAATTTTITSDATIPHFATLQRSESALAARPDSSASSAAADDLKRTLQRGESNVGQHSPLFQLQQQGSASSSTADSDSRNPSLRWGSMLSGLLSGRRRDSASNGGSHSRNSSTSSWDPLSKRSNPPSSPLKARHGSTSKESQQQQARNYETGAHPPSNTTAKDATQSQPAAVLSPGDPLGLHTPRLSQDSPNLGSGKRESALPLRQIPDPSGAFESPVKTTINAEDGVIDVDIQFPDYIRSFETAVSSPSSSGFLSTPGFGSGLDAFEQSCRISVDGDLPANVAGWLQSYHPDFCLQAIPPQGNLMAQIKESLRLEPWPAGFAPEAEHTHLNERWIDVSTAIVVDTTKLAITRLHYSRLIRPTAAADVSTPDSGNGPMTGPSPAIPSVAMPHQEMQQLDERFVEEPIVSTDSILTRAIERVIAQGAVGTGRVSFDHLASGGGSTVDSSGLSTDDSTRSSRSASIRRGRRDSVSMGPEETYPTAPRYVNPSPTAPLTPMGVEEVPRAECKTVILSALEEIVRDVVQSKDRDDLDDEGMHEEQKSEAEESNVLRSAVQLWLENVDMGEI